MYVQGTLICKREPPVTGYEGLLSVALLECKTQDYDMDEQKTKHKSVGEPVSNGHSFTHWALG